MEWLSKLLGMGGATSPFGALGGAPMAPGAPGSPVGGPLSGGMPLAQPDAPPPALTPAAAPNKPPGLLGANQNALNSVMSQAQKLIQGSQMQTPSWMPWMSR